MCPSGRGGDTDEEGTRCIEGLYLSALLVETMK